MEQSNDIDSKHDIKSVKFRGKVYTTIYNSYGRKIVYEKVEFRRYEPDLIYIHVGARIDVLDILNSDNLVWQSGIIKEIQADTIRVHVMYLSYDIWIPYFLFISQVAPPGSHSQLLPPAGCIVDDRYMWSNKEHVLRTNSVYDAITDKDESSSDFEIIHPTAFDEN
ncbi:MAG: hypothetical protein Sylvanvirus27_5 [Sylvanvirus sp.]|uniref:Uncharacterized protein n=1 Tax=Sylvanvirus sp. TaxID=2487774 RepID=A0A3G5AK88_9VIRU|nr:MAG: hypothetical protein Sylvanvirus27_5 [Sylvanvirus sp.]